MALTKEDLEQIAQLNAEVISQTIAAAIAESRKPLPPTQKEIQAVEMAQQARAMGAAGVLAEMENERATQRNCTHEHSKQAGGGTHGVWVREEDPRSPGYIYCQKCEATVRPDVFDANGFPCQRDRRALYSTELFNRLFQECGEQSVIG